MIFDIEEIKALIDGYVDRHPLVEERGSAYIMQDNGAKEDAVQLVCDIFDNMES
jgi:hypothetical protein